MIAVHAVFAQQLPVGSHGVLVGALGDLHADFGLIGDEVQVLLGAGQVFDQRFYVGIKTDEAKTPVAVDPGRRLQSQAGLLESGTVACFIWNADQIALVVERPGMVEALERFGGAFVLAAYHGSTVGAGVEEGPHLAVAAPGEKHGTAGHFAPAVFPGFFHFRLVAEVKPALVENPFLLQCKKIRRG